MHPVTLAARLAVLCTRGRLDLVHGRDREAPRQNEPGQPLGRTDLISSVA